MVAIINGNQWSTTKPLVFVSSSNPKFLSYFAYMEMLPRNIFNQKRRVGNTEQGAEQHTENCIVQMYEFFCKCQSTSHSEETKPVNSTKVNPEEGKSNES